MGQSLGKSKDISFTVNILIKKEEALFVAHCLELDIVAAAKTADQARKDIVSLVCAQIDYAFSNDNLENFYQPAAIDVWIEFYRCKEQLEHKYKLDSYFSKNDPTKNIPMPWIITKTCNAENRCHA